MTQKTISIIFWLDRLKNIWTSLPHPFYTSSLAGHVWVYIPLGNWFRRWSLHNEAPPSFENSSSSSPLSQQMKVALWFEAWAYLLLWSPKYRIQDLCMNLRVRKVEQVTQGSHMVSNTRCPPGVDQWSVDLKKIIGKKLTCLFLLFIGLSWYNHIKIGDL